MMKLVTGIAAIVVVILVLMGWEYLKFCNEKLAELAEEGGLP